ncbi:MAG: hypothetical protein ABI867_00540 [Kofleriaceae bacterium]
MRTAWLLVLVVACGKHEEAPRGTPGSPADPAPPIDAKEVRVDAAPVPDAAIAPIDAAVAVAPAVTTKIVVVGFEGIVPEKLLPMARAWIAWVEQHFSKCESDEKVEAVTTTATVTFKGDDITFDLPKVPAQLAACIEKNIRTRYLGYEPTPPRSLGKTTLKVKLKIGEAGAPPPPATGAVTYLASKVTGTRKKQELTAWLDANVAQQLKPCIDDTPIVQDLWKIGFEVDAGGKLGKVTSPGDAQVATCVQKVVLGLQAAKASGPNTVELVYVVKR